MRQTIWKKWKCGGGSRWTSVNNMDQNNERTICGFSGCGCGTTIKLSGVTTDRTEAANWFKRPNKKVA